MAGCCVSSKTQGAGAGLGRPWRSCPPQPGRRSSASFIKPRAREWAFSTKGTSWRLPQNPDLRAVLEAVNTLETLAQVRALTGFQDITHADGQATRYRGGHFSARHQDNIPGQARRVACV